LNAFDQTHLVRVWQWLVDLAVEDQDLLTAGLLHDVGKVDGNARVRLVDRGLKVVLRAAWPGLLDRLSRPGGPRWAAGLYLAVHHPELGAQRARALGCSERVCWLIEHHETQPDFGDPGLRLLRQADRAS
jgi:HD domain